ncbi:MAG: DUF6717 family protein [Candidatus Kariarchaeaceae archaeon]
MMNQLMVIYPYPTGLSSLTGVSGWAFDDKTTGLVAEPFVSGMPEIIDMALKHEKMERKKFRLVFSADFLPDYKLKLQLINTDIIAGNYYKVVEGPNDMLGMKGWLCPATLKYFSTYPETLYLKAGALS